MSFGGGSSTTVQTADPYAPAQPAMNQIIGEATNIYGAGPSYVAPSDLTLEGIASSEEIARSAQQQIANTIAGQYTNPFLAPMISQVADEAYTNVASQFSGAGRTPGSAVSQQQVAAQIGSKALPLAFQAAENERNRQLQTARAVPGLTALGQTLEDYEFNRQQAPQRSLEQYANIINPIARGGQTSQTVAPRPNRLGTAAGGALAGAALGSQINSSIGGYSSTAIGGVLGALGGLL